MYSNIQTYSFNISDIFALLAPFKNFNFPKFNNVIICPNEIKKNCISIHYELDLDKSNSKLYVKFTK